MELWIYQRTCVEKQFISIKKVLLLFSCSVMSDFLWSHGQQQARLPCSSLSPGVCSNSRALSLWCHPTISFSVTPFSFCPQSFPASGSFPVSQIFASGGQILELQLQHQSFQWILGLISFKTDCFDFLAVQGKQVSQVFSRTTVWKYQFFHAQFYCPTLTSIQE